MIIAEHHATHSDVAMAEARSIRARPTPLQSQAKAIAVAEDTSHSRPQHVRFSAQFQRNPMLFAGRRLQRDGSTSICAASRTISLQPSRRLTSARRLGSARPRC